MEGNLGNIALYPGLVPAECRLTNCFCLGKENKPYLGVEIFWEIQPCQSHLRLLCTTSLVTACWNCNPATAVSAYRSVLCFVSFTEKKGGDEPNKDLEPFFAMLHPKWHL